MTDDNNSAVLLSSRFAQEGHSRVRWRPAVLGWRRDAARRWPIVGWAVAETLAAVIADRRDPARITHTARRISCAPACWRLAAAIEDANDLDRLRFDPAFKLACGRLPDSGGDLCSQPTISRWENAPTLREIIRLDRRDGRSLLRRATRSRPRRLSWTSTTRSMSCTAISNCRNSMPTTMSAAFCRSMSTIRRPVARLP